jgi:hypothetical protein
MSILKELCAFSYLANKGVDQLVMPVLIKGMIGKFVHPDNGQGTHIERDIQQNKWNK